jgi:hypothetical protein
MKLSPVQTIMQFCALSQGLTMPEPEFLFAPPRKFRFDLCWPFEKIALEIEGGLYGNGKPCPLCKRAAPRGHSSVTGILRDMEKYNLAAELGFRVVRFTPQQIEKGEAFALLESLLA